MAASIWLGKPPYLQLPESYPHFCGVPLGGGSGIRTHGARRLTAFRVPRTRPAMRSLRHTFYHRLAADASSAWDTAISHALILGVSPRKVDHNGASAGLNEFVGLSDPLLMRLRASRYHNSLWFRTAWTRCGIPLRGDWRKQAVTWDDQKMQQKEPGLLNRALRCYERSFSFFAFRTTLRRMSRRRWSRYSLRS